MDSCSDEEDSNCSFEDFADFAVVDSLSQVRRNKEVKQISLADAQMDDLKNVAETLNIKLHNARTLLIHHRWDKEKLCSDFVEKGIGKLFADAGVPYQATFSQLEPLNMEEKILCGVCFEDIEQRYSTQMDCGHCFCNNCWTGHFISSIGQSLQLKCMAVKCGLICDEVKVLALLGAKDPKSQQRYQRFLSESYIEHNAKVKWCPCVPHCGYAVRIECYPCEIECICGHQFCFSCLGKAHSPCSCTMWQMWTKKCAEDLRSLNWITTHTKLCPNCNKPVEKSGGCNYILCACGQPFCWLCGGATGNSHDWGSIHGHSCGRYEKSREEIGAIAFFDWRRYIHYYTRYNSHADSLKREEEQIKSFKENVSVVQAYQLESNYCNWINNAVHHLLRARRILQYSYVFAFYMFGNDLVFEEGISPQQNKKIQELFEVQQQIFEECVEHLSKCIETSLPLTSETQSAMIGLAAIVDQRCQKMYEVIENDLLSLLITSHHISPYRSDGQENFTMIDCRSDIMDGSCEEEQSECNSTIMARQSSVDKAKNREAVDTK